MTNAPRGTASRRFRTFFLQALLLSVALLLTALPTVVVAGAFAPGLPVIGPFGGLVQVDLPGLLLEAIAASIAGALARRFGRSRAARLLAAVPFLTLGALVLVFAGFTAYAAAHGASFSISRQLSPAAAPPTADERRTFATVDRSELHVDIWRPVRSAAAGVPTHGAPAVVFVHGGSFVTGGLGSRGWLFDDLRQLGFAVFDIEYRLAPPPRWADAPADVLCALAWLRGASGELAIDAERIAVMGESAGGSLALVGGYAAGSDVIEPSCPGDPIVPAAVIAIVPTADLAGIWEDNTARGAGLRLPEAYVGGTPAEMPDRYAAASPFRLLGPGLPPTLLMGAANDHLVLPPRVISTYERFRAGGVDARLVMVPFAEHGFDSDPNSFGSQLIAGVIPGFLADVLQ